MIHQRDRWATDTLAHTMRGLRALLGVARKNPHFDGSRLNRLQWRWAEAASISARAFTLDGRYEIELGEAIPFEIRGVLDELLDAAPRASTARIDAGDLFELAPPPGAARASDDPDATALQTRRDVARAVAGRGTLFVMAHELAHVLRGHLELADAYGLDGIAEDYSTGAYDRAYPRRYIEYDADAFGIGLLLDLYEAAPSFATDTDADVAEQAYWIHLSSLVVLMLMDRRFPDGFRAGQQHPCFKRRALAISRALVHTIEARYSVGASLTGEALQQSWATVARVSGRLSPAPQRFWANGPTPAQVDAMLADIDRYVASESEVGRFAHVWMNHERAPSDWRSRRN